MKKCIYCDLEILKPSKKDFHKNCLKSIIDKIESLETIKDFGLIEQNNYLEMLSYVLTQSFKKPLTQIIKLYKENKI